MSNPSDSKKRNQVCISTTRFTKTSLPNDLKGFRVYKNFCKCFIVSIFKDFFFSCKVMRVSMVVIIHEAGVYA